VLTWVRTVFDTDVPTHSDAAALEQGLPLTMDRVSVGREVPIDLKSATRSGKTEVVEERYESMIAARAAVDSQYAANREITAAEKERALQVVQLINHRVDDAARRHNQRVSEVTTDLASLLEALKSIPQAAFKTDPANPSGAKLRRLSDYMDERSEELKSNTSLPEATKDDLVSIARTAAALADESYLEGDAATGDQLVEIAYETFEVAIGFTPAGTGVDLYKVAFNRDLLGRELSSTDRVIAIAGVASLGLGGALRSVGKGVALTKRLVKAIRASGRATEAADHLGDVERLAVAAEKIGLKGAGEIREIARDLGDAVPTPERLADVLDSAKEIGLDNAPQVKQLSTTIKKSGVNADRVIETLEAISKSDDFGRAVKATPADKAMFYVKQSGEAIPSTGYRYIPSDASYLDRLVSTGKMPVNPTTASEPHRATYFCFNKFEDAATASTKIQVPHDAAIRVEFDALQVVDDVKIPRGMYNTADYLEPLTKDYPQFGAGGAA
jgi:hypothetical protein